MNIKKVEGIPDAIWVEPTAPGIPEICSGIWEKFRSKDSDRYVGYTRTDIMQARIAELEAENEKLRKQHKAQERALELLDISNLENDISEILQLEKDIFGDSAARIAELEAESAMLRGALNTVHDTLDDKCFELPSLIEGEPPIAYQIDYLDMITINYALGEVLKDD